MQCAAGASALRHAVIGVELAPAEILLAPPHRHQPGEHGAAKTVGLVETERKQRQQSSPAACVNTAPADADRAFASRGLAGIDPGVFVPGIQIQLRQRIIAARRLGGINRRNTKPARSCLPLSGA